MGIAGNIPGICHPRVSDAELAGMICGYWTQQGNSAECKKWQRVQEQHLESID